ncbi:hypothetical protein HN51_063701 [Arachis hypogaea]
MLHQSSLFFVTSFEFGCSAAAVGRFSTHALLFDPVLIQKGRKTYCLQNVHTEPRQVLFLAETLHILEITCYSVLYA